MTQLQVHEANFWNAIVPPLGNGPLGDLEHIHEHRSADFINQLLVLFDLLVVHFFSVEHYTCDSQAF